MGCPSEELVECPYIITLVSLGRLWRFTLSTAYQTSKPYEISRIALRSPTPGHLIHKSVFETHRNTRVSPTRKKRRKEPQLTLAIASPEPQP
jgi:hypothetical protein